MSIYHVDDGQLATLRSEEWEASAAPTVPMVEVSDGLMQVTKSVIVDDVDIVDVRGVDDIIALVVDGTDGKKSRHDDVARAGELR